MGKFHYYTEYYIWYLKKFGKNIHPEHLKIEVMQLKERIVSAIRAKENSEFLNDALGFLNTLEYFKFDLSKVEEYQEKTKRN